MIYTLNGENDFSRNQALQELTTTFVKKYSEMAIERLDGETVELDRLREALHGLSLLAPNKLVVIREPSKQKVFSEEVEQILAKVPETTDVILIEPKLDKRLGYFKFLQKQTDFRTYTILDLSGLKRWIVDYVGQQGGQINTSDAQYLIERTGQHQLQLKNELDKLLLLGPKISRQAINQLTDRTPQSTIFELLEAAFSGKITQAQDLYSEQRALKVEPQAILAMLAWQIHTLAIVKTAGQQTAEQIAKQARLNPFVVRKTIALSRRLTLANIKQLVDQLLEIDVKTKTTALNADEALRLFLLRLSPDI